MLPVVLIGSFLSFVGRSPVFAEHRAAVWRLVMTSVARWGGIESDFSHPIET
jgi:hypothetical protein